MRFGCRPLGKVSSGTSPARRAPGRKLLLRACPSAAAAAPSAAAGSRSWRRTARHNRPAGRQRQTGMNGLGAGSPLAVGHNSKCIAAGRACHMHAEAAVRRLEGKCNWASGAGVGVAPGRPDSRPPNSHLRLAKLVGDVLKGRPLLGVGVVVHLLGAASSMVRAGGLLRPARGPQARPPRSTSLSAGGGARWAPPGRPLQKSAGAAPPAHLGPRRPLAAREGVHHRHRSAISLHRAACRHPGPTT